MRNTKESTFSIEVKGLVQGVGFRPFIYRIAKVHFLTGWVENRNDGVYIRITGNTQNINSFISDIRKENPPASNILSVESCEINFEKFNDFNIVKSKDQSGEITEISPDIAVCEDCLKDMQEQKNRIKYPFINCTNCGPRFTIIKDLPYDRDKTTMKQFQMCGFCSSEYTDILNRRFHAQPVACENCGPVYQMNIDGEIIREINKIISKACDLIREGRIIAIKGLGGFHLACDANNDKAVSALRKAKNREGKPFAVMFSGILPLKDYVYLDEIEEKRILSWQRPILLLQQKRKLAPDVSVGFNTIGAMLPYMPIHYLLFQELNIPAIVLTSGNISDEPIVIDNDEALNTLSQISDAVITNNRDIYNRTDDSVEMIISGLPRIIRRSRGFAPAPIRLNLDLEGIMATGAELVNCFCIGKGDQAILSQHIGDLKNMETLAFYEESINRFKRLFRFEPKFVVSDLHPDYLSSQYAEKLGIKNIRVQHHHAHIASCMAEHGLDEKVIGVSFDGTGLGDDNNIWGGEFFICDLNDYQRINHFDYVPLPGGDKVSEEPWRMAISYLLNAYGEIPWDKNIPFFSGINKADVEILQTAIENGINSPLSSSAGRLFDAVAALTNICPESYFHAEAPMRLESIIDNSCEREYDFSFGRKISFRKMIKQIVDDIQTGVNNSIISAKFHNTIISSIFTSIEISSGKTGIKKVVISGGVFQNKYLLEKTIEKLNSNNYKVYSQSRIPTNDGGIALGQIAIAAKRRELKCV
ncbi:carbamoyltransferase HypF [Bacteroidota bacterium]